MAKDPKYVFECVDLDSFELHFLIEADSKLFRWIFEKSRRRLEKKGVSVPNIDNVARSFKLEGRYLGLVRNYVARWVREVERDVAKDGVKLLKGWRVEECEFTPGMGECWDIDVLVVGRYA